MCGYRPNIQVFVQIVFFSAQIYGTYVSNLFFFAETTETESNRPKFEFSLGLCQESPIIKVLHKQAEIFTGRVIITPT
jgi:hypothetical protein